MIHAIPATAADIMSRHPIAVGAAETLSEIAETLDQNSISGVPVVDSCNRVIGVVSKTDLVCRILEGAPGSSVARFGEVLGLAQGTGCGLDPAEIGSAGDIMNSDPVTSPPDRPVHVLARQMSDERVHRVVIVDDDRKLLGVVTTLDILAKYPASEDRS